jgi:hypothetical protein
MLCANRPARRQTDQPPGRSSRRRACPLAIVSEFRYHSSPALELFRLVPARPRKKECSLVTKTQSSLFRATLVVLLVIFISSTPYGATVPEAKASAVPAARTAYCVVFLERLQGKSLEYDYWWLANCPTCGLVSFEINWDDGSGWGENQIRPNPPQSTFADVQWQHTYAQNGTYHVKIAADDASGNSCYSERTVLVQ